jgi:hypothetical protein
MQYSLLEDKLMHIYVFICNNFEFMIFEPAFFEE